MEVLCSTLWEESRPQTFRVCRILLTMPRWASMTPFGFPVDPLVKMM